MAHAHDAAELLGIDVQQLARLRMFKAECRLALEY
jgi:hypothetical protein